MSNNERWKEFLHNLLSDSSEAYTKTKEYEYWEKQCDEIDMLLRDSLKPEQKEIVEECIYDIELASDREVELAYQQGMKDCVWLLKNLGVLV